MLYTKTDSHSVSHPGVALAENLAVGCTAHKGSWHRFSSVGCIELAKLFVTSFSPLYPGEPEGTVPAEHKGSFTLTIPGASDLPGIVRFGSHLVAQALPGSSMAGGLAAALATFCSSFQLTAGASEAIANSVSGAVAVPDGETLGKIGKHPDFPLNGRYQQTNDIAAQDVLSIGCRLSPFTGDYDGGGHKIIGLKDCLFDKMGGNSTVRNLRVVDANVTSQDPYRPVGVIACRMEQNARIMNAVMENSRAETLTNDANVALGAGTMEGKASIRSLNAVNSSVSSHGSNSMTAIGSGSMKDDTRIDTLNALRCQVSSEASRAYISVGTADARGRAVVNDVAAFDCQLHSTGRSVASAIGAGAAWDQTKVVNILAVGCNSSVEVVSPIRPCSDFTCAQAWSAAGVGLALGDMSTVSNITAVNSRFHAQVSFYECDAHAAVGAGEVRPKATVKNIEAVNCHISTHGSMNEYAAVGEAMAWVGGNGPENVRAWKSSMMTKGNNGAAAIGGLKMDGFGAPPHERFSGIACDSYRVDRDGYYQYPDSPECADICWTSVGNVTNNATGIHFDRGCEYATFNPHSTTAPTHPTSTAPAVVSSRAPTPSQQPPTEGSTVDVVGSASPLLNWSAAIAGGLLGIAVGAGVGGLGIYAYRWYSGSGGEANESHSKSNQDAGSEVNVESVQNQEKV